MAVQRRVSVKSFISTCPVRLIAGHEYVRGLCSLILFLISPLAFSQNVILNGHVNDGQTGEAIIGASVRNVGKSLGTVSNTYGYFILKSPSGISQLNISCVGYESLILDLNAASDTTLNIRLSPASHQLEEILVKAKSNIAQSSAGYMNIPVNRLKAIPILFGEADIVKALALTPGVTTGNEGTTGLLVRGGTPDQNLILLDDAPVYNTAHLFGLVSIFNTDAVKNVEMYKGGFPARYGGRLSSIFDISMKEGNKVTRKTERTIGLVSSRMLWEGPLSMKDKHYGKSSYLIAARTSYLTLFLLPKYLLYQAGKSSNYFNYWLYDLNAKINYQLNPKTQVFLSLYHGNDFYSAGERSEDNRGRMGLSWGNTTVTTRYNYVVRPKLFLKSILSFSRYHYGISTKSAEKDGRKWEETSFIKSSSIVNDLTNKTSIEWFPGSGHTLRAGLQASLYRYRPMSVKTSIALPPDSLSKMNAPVSTSEVAAFAEYELSVGNWLKTNVGGRAVSMQVNSKKYQNLEPRAAVNFIFPGDFALKGAYSKMNQYIHLLTSNSVGLPNDVWVPATGTIKPSSSVQYTIGVSKTLGKQVEVSIDAYDKSLSNLIDYSANSSFLMSFNKSWQSLIEQNGMGRIRGIEVFINKTKGDFTGWAGYSLSRNERRFDRINEGEWYPSNFDRRHVISLVGSYTAPTTNTTFSVSWVYQSGAPVTMPIAVHKQFDEGQVNIGYPTFIYGARNSVRLPAYHRLDFSTSFDLKRRGRMTLGVYNLYNRLNPYYLTVDLQPSNRPAPSQPFTGMVGSVNKVGVLPFLPYFSHTVTF
ncbi:hypothetical protein DSL64_16020 [Dyadobacter luteus]|uniref:TonB-dependent receptor n=1 Tax=Dyadobacter luteus TaxID=2259619 RepID=A0A3D8Y9T0_9BACT|nr:TonB-dependent receptor [Dyadobacter luteus]REA60178.1 hypothetical protein DSL64_16020 [Dyadobacter luteus]